MKRIRLLLKGKKYSQEDLIPLLVLVVNSLGGSAPKQKVDEQIYDLLNAEFSMDVYHEKVSHGVPRWQHDIAWAKEKARQNYGYMKSAGEAGHGTWELTEKGIEYANKLIKKLEVSTRVIRRRKTV